MKKSKAEHLLKITWGFIISAVIAVAAFIYLRSSQDLWGFILQRNLPYYYNAAVYEPEPDVIPIFEYDEEDLIII